MMRWCSGHCHYNESSSRTVHEAGLSAAHPASNTTGSLLCCGMERTLQMHFFKWDISSLMINMQFFLYFLGGWDGGVLSSWI